MNAWKPCNLLNVGRQERLDILYSIKQMVLTPNEFHDQFKEIEKKLLIHTRDYINNIHEYKIYTLCDNWVAYMKSRWRMVAIFRDFHDFICGRDSKHYIRTDDCRRFMLGVINGINTKTFIKPVYRLLCGNTAPNKFKHPLFIKFNQC
jgi:hypothetical protein